MKAKDLYRLIKRPIKKRVNTFARNNKAFDAVYSRIIRRKRQKTFSKYCNLPIEKGTIIFESFMGRRYADSPKAIYEYMLNNDSYSEYKFVWSFRGGLIDNLSQYVSNNRTDIVAWGSDEYYKEYAKAEYWIANTRLPESIIKKPGQVYVQCWHGTPLKKIGMDIPFDSAKDWEITRRVIHKDAERYSYLLSPSRYYSTIMASALDLKTIGKEGVIIETGYPRNDAIVNCRDENIKTIKKSFGIHSDSKVILYAPTYREDRRSTRYEYDSPLDVEHLLDSIPDNYVLLFRTHYFISEEFDFTKYSGRIIDVSMHNDVNDLYIISDMLITDYSSVFFDYSILDRPILFYMYDLKHYKDELRGLYLDTAELPGPVTETQKELEERIWSFEKWGYSEGERKLRKYFREKYTYLEDGKATERVVDKILT